MLTINSEIQPFEATGFRNGEVVEVSDSDVKGKWSIFFFYPADFTFVCPTELGDLADHYEELQAMGVEVYSVSTDTHLTTRPGQTPSTPPHYSQTCLSIRRMNTSVARLHWR